jgi:hypothetical protein
MDLRNHRLQSGVARRKAQGNTPHSFFFTQRLCQIEIAVTNLRSPESLYKCKLLIVPFSESDAEISFQKVVSISKFSKRRMD